MTRWAASVLLILLVLDLMMVITLSTRWKGYRERYLVSSPTPEGGRRWTVTASIGILILIGVVVLIVLAVTNA